MHASHMLGTVLGAGEKPEGEPSHRDSHSRGRGSQTPVQRGLGVPDLGWQCCGAESAGAACQDDQEEMREGQEVVLGLALKDEKDFTWRQVGRKFQTEPKCVIVGAGAGRVLPWSSPGDSCYTWCPWLVLH